MIKSIFLTLSLLTTFPAQALEFKTLKFLNLDKIIESQSSTLELHAFSLKTGKKDLGRVYTITGEPKFIELKMLASTPFELALLRYDAGTAGTAVLMQMDRVAILVRRPGQKSWKVIGDHAIALRRYQGVRPLLELDRTWEWDAKGKKIRFESFDEDPVVEYVWNEKDKNFIRNVR